jgi:8-oxo-dGTP diphosphatase
MICYYFLMSENENRIRVGVGVMLFKDGKILLAKRKNSTGAGEYCWPGGKMEFGESFAECAKRETREETGLEITNIRFLRLMNLKYENPAKHFVDIELMADWQSGEPKLLEPEKFESWAWYDLNELPEPLFLPQKTALEAYKTGKIFFDA